MLPAPSKLKIPGFSPNCLMGAVAAVAQHQLGINGALERLYFCHTFRYTKRAPTLAVEDALPLLNASFTRELPLSKDEFAHRLRHYYCIELLNKEYRAFDELLDDLAWLTSAGELPLTEIDFFHMRRHPYFRAFHDQHMMVVTGVDRERRQLAVCEAVFGDAPFSLDDYRGFFDEVTHEIRRPFYLALVRRTPGNPAKLSLEQLRHDLQFSLANLHARAPDQGLLALEAFVEDMASFCTPRQRPCRIYGMWVFMCDLMNNLRFAGQLKCDYPALADQPWFKTLERSLNVLSRRWFSVTTDLDAALDRGDSQMPPNTMSNLRMILADERQLVEQLGQLETLLRTLL